MLLSQKHFTCAEANLGSEADSMPLTVMAISENLVPWPAYAKLYSKFEESLQGETLQGHFNPGVQAAAAEVSGKNCLFRFQGALVKILVIQVQKDLQHPPLLSSLCSTPLCINDHTWCSSHFNSWPGCWVISDVDS